ncbi:arginine vasopressin-induced protein 1 [Tiliqua scincoides]|uniref:arginine vasopressin-induced protein 1 n=1 Tax=Tiliqua scincoides TaxID=71010 RepID=UPI0034621798
MTGSGAQARAAESLAEPALAGLQDSARDPERLQDQQRPPELPPATAWRDPNIMGTPASIVCDLPKHQTPNSCPRKRASANIFQGVGLLQLRRLFHNSGDAQAEERAQLVWERAGNRCIAQALQQLHRRQRKQRLRSHLRSSSGTGSGTRLLELQHFSHLRIEDCTTSCSNDDGGGGGGGGSSSKKVEAASPTSQNTAFHWREKKRGKGAVDYLHQLHR